MKAQLAGTMVGVVMLVVLVAAPVRAEDRMLSHDVYFSLKNPSPETSQQLVAACKKYLSGHPGTVWFAAGARAKELAREVNDQGFDVALHVVFKNKAAHDAYQKAPRHLKFIEESQGWWAKVRVFDSYLDATSHEAMPSPAGKP